MRAPRWLRSAAKRTACAVAGHLVLDARFIPHAPTTGDAPAPQVRVQCVRCRAWVWVDGIGGGAG